MINLKELIEWGQLAYKIIQFLSKLQTLTCPYIFQHPSILFFFTSSNGDLSFSRKGLYDTIKIQKRKNIVRCQHSDTVRILIILYAQKQNDSYHKLWLKHKNAM